MKLALFFSRGISLSTWQESGLLDRELATYKRMLPHLEGISLITYGKDQEELYIRDIEGFRALYNRWRLPADLFSLLSPILYRSDIQGIDVLKTNQINGWWTAGLAKLLYGKKLVIRCGYLLSLDQERKGYCRIRTSIVSCIERLAFRYSDVSIVTTPIIRKEVVRRYGLSPKSIRVIPNPVDTDIFRPLPGVKKVDGRVGFIGRFSPEKNIDLLLNAVSGIEDTSLLLIGDGVLRNELENLSSRIGVKATFLGNIPNHRLPELLNTCQVFVLPSQWEGMPKALIEAMACGLPVIGTDVPGIREIIEDGKTGCLCRPSMEELRSAIRKTFEDSVFCDRLGIKAREYVTQNYSIEKVVSMELELLSDLAHE